MSERNLMGLELYSIWDIDKILGLNQPIGLGTGKVSNTTILTATC